ncbi:MAG: toll/interleukin-1 receptor domain-containing protein [Planctomycetaceae bacterium]|nr:toll/interleukin-1 receptor domain-containing protein [Planctomycetaceae bacterium]
MDGLTAAIQELPRAQIFEAVLALRISFVEHADGDAQWPKKLSDFLTEIQNNPFRCVEELEQLARAFLLAVTCDTEWQSRVRTVLDGTGRKNFIFGASEMLIAGQTSVLALTTLLTWWRNRRSTDSIEVEIDADGKWTISCGATTLYENRGRIGDVIASISNMVKHQTSDDFTAFLSYRRLGDSETARAIRAELKSRNLRAFLDIDDLGRAAFDEQLLHRIESIPNFVIVLSPGALDRCLSDDDDWVRKEIAHAFLKNRNIIPVLKDDFKFPASLPSDIANLPRINGVIYSHVHFESVVNKMIAFMNT